MNVGVCLLLVALAGCRRVSIELGQDLSVEAGVPVSFGDDSAKELSFVFGDGHMATGGRVTHAFARSGSYTVRVLRGDDELDRVTVNVEPRPVLAAVPTSAQGVLYISQLRDNIEPVLDYLERLVGPASFDRFLDRIPMGRLLPLLSGGSALEATWLDLEEGLALYWSEDGTVLHATLGVADTARALDEMKRMFGDGSPAELARDGSIRIASATSGQFALFEDRGYVFVVLANDGSEGRRALDAAVREVRESNAKGFAGRVGDRLHPGELQPAQIRAGLFPLKADATIARLSARFEASRLVLDGTLESKQPIWRTEEAIAPALLQRAPEGPVLAVSVSAAPAALADLAFGKPVAGLSGAELESLRGAVDGSLAALAYFDAAAFAARLLEKDDGPEAKGTVVAEAGIRTTPAISRLVKVWTETFKLSPVARAGGSKVSRYAGFVGGHSVGLELGESRLGIEAGEPLAGRSRLDLRPELEKRFGAGAFGPGHVSVLLDVGQVRRELESTRATSKLSPLQANILRGLAGSFLDQITPLDHIYFDLLPSPEGARFRGQMVLRSGP